MNTQVFLTIYPTKFHNKVWWKQ